MDFRHPPIRPLTDQARNDTIPNSLRNYVDNVQNRTEPGYEPPRAATMAMTVPHPSPAGRRSEGDRPLADYKMRVAFGSSDVKNKERKGSRLDKEERIGKRKAIFRAQVLPQDDRARRPGTSGPDDPGN